MKEATRQSLRAALFEAAFVVLGVVLALAANEWREQRASAARADHALAGILEELEENRRSVASSLAYHQGILEAIDAAAAASETPGIGTFSRGFVSAANVYRTAWESASATGAFETMDFETVLSLSRAYAQQERYEHQAQGIAPLIYEDLYRGGTGAILANYSNLASLVRTLAYRERELLELYDETLANTTEPH